MLTGILHSLVARPQPYGMKAAGFGQAGDFLAHRLAEAAGGNLPWRSGLGRFPRAPERLRTAISGDFRC